MDLCVCCGNIWADEDINEQTKTMYQYVLELRERLESTCKLAHDELRKAQGNQHKWFNKKAKAKHLKEGDQVLLLLPTKLNKLEMQWQGPFDIIKKVRENDCHQFGWTTQDVSRQYAAEISSQEDY